MTGQQESIDTGLFRKTIGLLATGVNVILSGADGQVHGMTASAVMSLSLEPMLMLVCVWKKSKMADVIRQAGRFSVNILSADQEAVSGHFAGARGDQTAAFRITPWGNGSRLEGCLAAVLCEVAETIDGGDHYIITGRVTDLYRSGHQVNPLIVFAGSYRELKSKPIAPAPERLDEQGGSPHIFYDPWENN